MAKIEKQHNPCLVEAFNSEEDFNRHESECEIYKAQFSEIVSPASSFLMMSSMY